MWSANPARACELDGPAVADRLESWKEIATYLRRDIRTVYRWELSEALPVHRHVHKKRGTVYAYRSELDAWQKCRRKTTPSIRRVMLAVLPFTNLSGDPQQDYLSDGLTEEVLAQLGGLHLDRLGVIARTSVMRYKGTRKAINVIGQELGVDYVLEGSMRRSADRVRVTAQLIHVRDQTHLWAECYDKNMRDVLLLQSEIARSIARQIHVQVTPEGSKRLARVHQINSDAHEAYLKGRFHLHKLSREHLDIALRYFELALEKDPRCALAYVGIAYVWFCRGDCGFLPPRESFPKARAAALKAMELDDTLAEAHELLGNVRRHFDWDWTGAEAAFRRTIQLDPNYPGGYFMYADLLVSIGRFREAGALIEKTLELDPLNCLFHCFHGWHLVYLRRYDEAIAKLRETLRSEPGFTAAHLGLWGAFYKKGEYGTALAEAREFFHLLGDDEVAAALDGDSEDGYARATLLAAKTLAVRSRQTHVPAVRVARLYAHGGDQENALDWLEKASEEREPALVHLGVAWDWDNLRNHARFRALRERMGLSE